MSRSLLHDLPQKKLENIILNARIIAESAAKKRLHLMEVRSVSVPPHLTELDRRVRAGLRGLWQQLGGNETAWEVLIEEVAYAQWHRLLFARFLLENDLLLHPDLGVAVTLAELEDLASESGERDAWALAARYASAMLPGIFRQDDAAAQVVFAPEDRQAMKALVTNLPTVVFTADDALGWVYQFWQAQRKETINKSEVKIGAAEIAPVTQLFTEEYMVRFLLENSLGAWWAGKYPESPLLREFTYLRFGEDGLPAAGTFDGWPATVAEVTVMDPCCGSGHFLVAALGMLRQMRMEEEGLDARAATDAVLRDNLFGLEIDPRCIQIAAFALALTSWKASGYHPLPLLHLACSGIAAGGTREDWQHLAGPDSDETRNLRIILGALYDTFKDAPTLGSLIDPASVANEYKMANVAYNVVEPLLAQALHKNTADPVAAVFGDAAEGMLRAARLLSGKYTLVATNVPYLSSSKQVDSLRIHCAKYYPNSKADLATTFLERIKQLVQNNGSYTTVTSHNWLFIGSYSKFRNKLLQFQTWNMVILLGTKSFQSPMWDFGISMIIIKNHKPTISHHMVALDISDKKSIGDKQEALRSRSIISLDQLSQLGNPDARVTLSTVGTGKLLSEYADGVHGLGTKDSPRFIRCFWEVKHLGGFWELMQSTIRETKYYGGLEHIVLWENGAGILNDLGRRGWAVLAGSMAYDKHGVLITQMRNLPASLYQGKHFDKNGAVISVKNPEHLPAIWAFCSSPEYHEAVRRIDKKLNVTNATLVKVPFDLERWQRVADDIGPLPEPYSDDPTQWLFKGHPVGSSTPLHVALARLLGYCWPQQSDDDLNTLAVADGILCLVPIHRQPAGVDRLRNLMVAAYGLAWSVGLESELLVATGGKTHDLATWLRDEAIAQHNMLFHQRPFLWHIWDGRPDGFSAIVNYHRLDTSMLRKLTYTYLGEWIDRQRDDQRQGVTGAEPRLAAALELQTVLERILEGEKLYDIYIRWKTLAQQPIGWEPDLNDGVRLNIRPFMLAELRKEGKRNIGILRARPSITRGIDRGKNPDSSERNNDLHFLLEEKREAREHVTMKLKDDLNPKQHTLVSQ